MGSHPETIHISAAYACRGGALSEFVTSLICRMFQNYLE